MLTIRNFTAYPDGEVNDLVRWAVAPTGIADTLIHVTTSKQSKARIRSTNGSEYWLNPYSGRAYPSLPHDMRPWPASARRAIKLRIAAPNAGAYPMPRAAWRYGWEEDHRDGWPLFQLASWQEALVMIAAHEAKHVEYFNERKEAGELRCEVFAAQQLSRFREGGIAVSTVTHNGVFAELLDAVKAIEGVQLVEKPNYTTVKHGKQTLGYVTGKKSVRVDLPMRNGTRANLHVETKADVAHAVKEMESFIKPDEPKPKAKPKAQAKSQVPQDAAVVPGSVVLAAPEREAKPDPKPDGKKH